MRKLTRDKAIKEINDLIEMIPAVIISGRLSSVHTKWLFRCHNLLEDIFGIQSRYYVTFSSFKWGQTGAFIVDVLNFQNSIEKQHDNAFRKQMESAKGLLEAALDDIQNHRIEDLYIKSPQERSNDLIKIINIMERKLRKVIRDIPTKEKIVQDSIENLFIGADINYSREKITIEYSSKTYIPDFIIEYLDLALEVKLCNREQKEKVIISEINDDILAYQTKFKNIIFLVYDIGLIRDIDRFKDSFEKNDNVIVLVIKH